MLAVVGDGRSGDPLHERDDKRDVYEGEVSEVDSVSELVRRVDGVVDGLRPLVDVARGSAGGECGDVFEEVEERFAHPSVRVHHEREEFLMHRRGRRLNLIIITAYIIITPYIYLIYILLSHAHARLKKSTFTLLAHYGICHAAV